jgi:proline iminopeptidase
MNNSQVVNHYRREGTSKSIEFEGVCLSTRTYESNTENPITLIGICGGPGLTKQHLAPLSVLSEDGYRVVLYDQHNTGKSDDHPEPYDIGTFINGLYQVVSNYENVVIVGHSWGSMLALEYAVNANNIKGLVGVAPLFDSKENSQIAKTRRSEFVSPEKAEFMSDVEDNGVIPDEGLYKDIEDDVMEILGLKPPVPKFLKRWVFDEFNSDMYKEMWGRSEFYVDEKSVLYDWSIKSSLNEIECPVLLTTGEDDLFGYHDLYQAENMMDCKSTVNIIKNASHTPHWETKVEFRKVLLSWLSSQIN